MAAIHDLLAQVQDEALRARLEQEINRLSKTKKFGLVFEEHLPECTPLYDIPVKRGSTVAKKTGAVSEMYEVNSIKDGIATCYHKVTGEKEEIAVEELVSVAQFGEPIYPYLKPIDSVCNAPDSDLWHTLIEADNYHALQLLEYLYAGKVDCIYIDPPYNTGAKDWKYNNDYVDGADAYRHSKWLSFLQKRLKIAKQLLNPDDSVLIVTIDEKEYLHLGCLLEEMFPDANIQMIVDIINPRGTNRESEFSRVEEYVYICRIGNSNVIKLENNMLGNTDETDKARVWYGFNRPNNPRSSAPGQFFPIYIDEKTKKVMKVGEALPLNADKSIAPKEEGLTAVFPINSHGNESIWGAIPETTRQWVEKGYIRLNPYDKKHKRWTFSYIRGGLQKRIESGEVQVEGRVADGSINLQHLDVEGEVVPPKTVWYQKSHKSYDFGSTMIKKIIPNHDFAFPKSVYSVHDALRFFVVNKPNALIIDFFAGSGTTMHAVSLLNAEDGGHRRCICVTNNEVSEAEGKSLRAKGFKPGDEEWDALGIARYITWPRIVSCIKGVDVNGKPLEGNYGVEDEDYIKRDDEDHNGCYKKGKKQLYPKLAQMNMKDGLKDNAAFFKLGFLDKTSIALGRQLADLFPVLWLKAGAHSACPEFKDEKEYMQVLPENRFAILIDEKHFQEFEEEVKKHPEIQTIYIVTDSEAGYREMISGYGDKDTDQLYRDYLDNFRINTGR